MGRRRRALLIPAALAALALPLAGCTTSNGSSKTTTPRITSLTAEAANADEIDLTWAATGTGIHGYRVSRDGTYLNLVEATSYEDTGVEPDTTYTYELSVRDAKGRFVGEKTVTASTPAPPPLSQARLDGSYYMRMQFTSENYSNWRVGERRREPWTFTARCDSGACGAVVQTNRRGEHKAHLVRRGATYSGKGTDTLFACEKVRITETYAVTLHVVRGAYVDGQWSAKAVVGTLTLDGPPVNGCAAGHATMSLHGVRYSA
jgi:hypothetical protein